MTAPANTEPPPGRLPQSHIPVLLSEVCDALKPIDGATYIDATFGAGGYTSAILEAAKCRVIAFDRDPTAIAAGETLLNDFADRLTLIHAPFGAMGEVMRENSFGLVDGVVFDLGVSSMQLDQAERGFSFANDGPLDMRMFVAPDGSVEAGGNGVAAVRVAQEGPSAADVVNTFEETALANLIYDLGEERRSRAVARAIVARRKEKPFATTLDLANVVAKVVRASGKDGKHPATRTFQALRMFVNDELGELARGLGAAEEVLKPGGRLAVVSFHSLEDRVVKRFLTEKSGNSPAPSRHVPVQSIKLSEPCFRIVNRRPLTPSKGELDVNPRARSARLRIAERTNAPAFTTSS